MMYFFALILSAMLFSGTLFSKVVILTFHYNQADFIEIQHRCLQKFMLDEYELIVFNDASTTKNESEIQGTCNRLGIQCVRFEPEWHCSDPSNNPYPSYRHARVIQYALDHYGYDNNDPVVIMDGDAFFIRSISVRDRLQDLDIFGMARGDVGGRSVNYLWPPFIAFDPRKLPNVRDLKFHPTVIDGYPHDTGAESHNYLKNNPSVKFKRTLPELTPMYSHVPAAELVSMGFSRQEIALIRHLHQLGCQVELNIDRCVLHFREVSFEAGKHYEKLECLYKFMRNILR